MFRLSSFSRSCLSLSYKNNLNLSLSLLHISSLNINDKKYYSNILQNPTKVKERDIKPIFEEGNVRETLKNWENEANINELDLVTEKIGIDKNKYKDISIKLGDIINLRTKILGGDHPETLYSNGILAATYRVVGKYKSASNIIKQCLTILEKYMNTFKKYYFNLYGAFSEEFARIHMATKEYESVEKALKYTIGMLDGKDKYIQLSILHKLLAECYLEQNKLDLAQIELEKSNECILKAPDNSKLQYYLLIHWNGSSSALFNNTILKAKIHSRSNELQSAEKALQSAWDIAVSNKGKHSIECCNAYLEILDFYSRPVISKQINVQSYLNILKEGLNVARTTDKILRETKGIDKRIIYPYYPMIQRGLRTLLQIDEEKDFTISLLFESLRIHEKYPLIYPSDNKNTFTTVMALVQLLRETNQNSLALDIISKYRQQFLSLKTVEPEYIIPLIEVYSQLIIATNYDSKPKSGNIPLSKQLKVTTGTREAVEGLEYVCSYYLKKKNTENAIKTLHSLAIIQTLQEEYSYAERDAHRAIKLIESSFSEYSSGIEISKDDIPIHHLARICDLIILRGSILRVQHESSRSLNHFKIALELLSKSRISTKQNTLYQLQDELSRTGDIIRCLDLIMEISEATLTEYISDNKTEDIKNLKQFISVCESHKETAVNELNRLHARLEKKTKSKQIIQQLNQEQMTKE